MKKPMPLSQLPDYMESARENGQEDIPVVDMGRIVSSREPRKLNFTYVTIACLFLSLGLAYVVNSTREITIISNASLSEVSKIVSQEWLLNESNNIANKPQYHKIEILGWSLSKGTLPPWGFLGDAGIDITSVFAGRASDPESTKVYNAALKLRKENPDACQYIHENIRWLRRTARGKDARAIRSLQYSFMTGKVLKHGENPPEDFVAPDVGGGPDGKGSGSQPSGISKAPTQPTQQASKQVSTQPQQPQTGSKVVTCPHCRKQFSV